MTLIRNCIFRFGTTGLKVVFLFLILFFFHEETCRPQEKSVNVKPLFSIEGFSPNDPFVTPTCLHYDENDEHIYIADAGRGEVGIFEKDGFLIKKIGKHEGLVEPVGIAVDKYGNVYISDRVSGRVVAFDFLGKPAVEYDLASAAGEFPVHPGRIALDGEGRLFLLDQSNKRIAVFDREGEVLEILGVGKVPGAELSMPMDITFGQNGDIYVVDSIGNPLKIYKASGAFIKMFKKEQGKIGAFRFAVAAEVDGSGRTWIVDSFAHQVIVFDVNRVFEFSFGGLGLREGRFFFPIDIALDEKGGRVFILEKDGKRMQAFSYKN